jgi:hypothetical protein
MGLKHSLQVRQAPGPRINHLNPAKHIQTNRGLRWLAGACGTPVRPPCHRPSGLPPPAWPESPPCTCTAGTAGAADQQAQHQWQPFRQCSSAAQWSRQRGKASWAPDPAKPAEPAEPTTAPVVQHVAELGGSTVARAPILQQCGQAHLQGGQGRAAGGASFLAAMQCSLH